jgi:hypothetical protein
VTQRLERKEAVMSFLVSLGDLKALPFTGAHGCPIPSITKFEIKPVKSDLGAILGYTDLCDGDRHLVPASEVLSQCSVGATDVVIVQRTHKSLITPLHWILAVCGNGVDVSDILVVVFEASGKGKEVRLTGRPPWPRWERWESAVFEIEPNKSADSTTSAGISAAEQPRVPASAASHL